MSDLRSGEGLIMPRSGDRSREDRRSQMVPQVAHLTRSKEYRERYPDHSTTVIPLLPDDTMEYLLRILTGTSRALLVVQTDDGVRVVPVGPASVPDRAAQMDAARTDS